MIKCIYCTAIPLLVVEASHTNLKFIIKLLINYYFYNTVMDDAKLRDKTEYSDNHRPVIDYRKHHIELPEADSH